MNLNRLWSASGRFIGHRHIRTHNQKQILPRGNDMPLPMRHKSPPKIIRRADVDVAVTELKEMDVPHTAVSLRSYGASGDTLGPAALRGWPATRSP